jgi:hypothetical protein
MPADLYPGYPTVYYAHLDKNAQRDVYFRVSLGKCQRLDGSTWVDLTPNGRDWLLQAIEDHDANLDPLTDADVAGLP